MLVCILQREISGSEDDDSEEFLMQSRQEEIGRQRSSEVQPGTSASEVKSPPPTGDNVFIIFTKL